MLIKADAKLWKNLTSSTDMAYVQDFYKLITKRGDLEVKFWKTVLSQPENKRIAKITEILKKEYGIKYTYFETPEDAEKVLKAVKYARDKNIPIPDNIIMTPAFNIDGGQNILTSDLERTVIINTQRTDDILKNILRHEPKDSYNELISAELQGQDIVRFSTPHELHVILHEFEHSRNFLYSNVKIPKKHLPAVNGLSYYARRSFNLSNNDEIRNELLTKRDILGLNESEKALLSLWG